jgi:hypothetical protein
MVETIKVVEGVKRRKWSGKLDSSQWLWRKLSTLRREVVP